MRKKSLGLILGLALSVASIKTYAQSQPSSSIPYVVNNQVTQILKDCHCSDTIAKVVFAGEKLEHMDGGPNPARRRLYHILNKCPSSYIPNYIIHEQKGLGNGKYGKFGTKERFETRYLYDEKENDLPIGEDW